MIRSNDYSDIINTEYPKVGKPVKAHPPMSLGDRAKIFSPFAALKGYEESLALRQEEVIDYTNYHLVEREEFFDD